MNEHLIIRALLRQPVERTPVWIMRQAGRYLPEYRALRKQAPSFMDFCKTPELACQATLQPLARFDLDAAIVFSDILTIPAAMGCDLNFESGVGPVIANPMRSQRDIDRLKQPDVEDALGYVMKTIQYVCDELDDQLPLIGFAGSPWTVATYMVEGGATKSFSTIKAMLYRNPAVLHNLLERLTTLTIDYLNAQIRAGVRVIMLFDSWGGVLAHNNFDEFSLQYMRRIAEGLQREIDGQKIPVVFFTRQASQWLELMAESGCDALGVDWTVDIGEARFRVDGRVALQGNLDPMVLFAKPEAINHAVRDIIDRYGPHPGHVFNLGHGIDKDTPIEGVYALIEAVKTHSTQQYERVA